MIRSYLHRRLPNYGIAVSNILLSGLLLISCSPNANRQVKDVMVCTYNPQNKCIESQTTFPATTPDIMVNANLENVVEGTVIGIQWIYQDGELGRSVEIADTVFRKVDGSITSMYAILRRPDQGWPQGNYEVILSSDESNVDPVQHSFSMVAGNSSNPTNLTTSVSAQGGSEISPSERSMPVSVSGKFLDSVTLCQLNEQEKCITEMALLPVTSPGVRVTANVSTAPIGTTVEARWRYVEGSLEQSGDIQTILMTKTKDGGNWVQSSLKRPEDGWPKGQYEVALSIVPNSSEITVKRFFVQ